MDPTTIWEALSPGAQAQILAILNAANLTGTAFQPEITSFLASMVSYKGQGGNG